MNNTERTKAIAVVMAIIYQDGKYLMQLRDDIPTIVYPGVWGFFGGHDRSGTCRNKFGVSFGHIEAGESPEVALRRELIEEINYSAPALTKFCSIQGENYLRHLFHCPLTVTVSDLELNEGWDLKLLTPQEITQGFAYSQRAIANKPLGDVHRQIMLNFIATVNQP